MLVIDAAFDGVTGRAQVFWSTLDEPGTNGERSLRFDSVSDGQFREIRIRLAGATGYRGAITSLRIDPADRAGGSVRLRAVRLVSR